MSFKPNNAVKNQKQTKKIYVFGSSTPRGLSHSGNNINKNQQLNKKENNVLNEKKSITYFMRQARSMTPASIYY